MKRVSILLSVLVLAVAAVQLNVKAEAPLKCLAAPTVITGPSTMHWNGATETFSTQIVCDVVEYEWVLNEGTTYQVSQITDRTVEVGPCDFVLTHPSATDCCGTWTISVRAKVDNGVDPIYWTAYTTKTVVVNGCP